MRDEVEGESWEDGRKKVSQPPALHQTRDELKHSKHTCLHGDQFTITVTVLTLVTPAVDHTHHIPGIPESRTDNLKQGKWGKRDGIQRCVCQKDVPDGSH